MKIGSLTEEQKAKFPEYVDKWIRIGLETKPANRKKAEEGIIKSYEIAGKKAPKIIWCDSPLSMALTRAIVLKHGEEVRKKIGDSVRDSVGDSVWASVGDSVWASVRDSVWASVRDSVGDSVRASVRDSVGDSVWASVRDSVWASVWASVGDSVRDSVGDSGYGQHDASWIGFYNYFREVLKLVKQTDKLEGLREITENAGWYLPHEGICWVSERHCVVLQDSNKRMHCETGPAIKYPDGWSLYYWHGVKIPGWIVEKPEDITVANIDAETNAEIRRVMMNKFGMARYFEEKGAKEVHRDRDTKGERILYQMNDNIGKIQVIKLENSTPERDGSKKYYTFRCHPDAKTCQEAVAIMYSMEPNKYQPIIET